MTMTFGVLFVGAASAVVAAKPLLAPMQAAIRRRTPLAPAERLYTEREVRRAVEAAIEAERARREPYPRHEA